MKQEEEEKIEKPIEEPKVQIVQQATEFQQLFQTPDGVMDMPTYLAWMGNLLIGIKEGIVG